MSDVGVLTGGNRGGSSHQEMADCAPGGGRRQPAGSSLGEPGCDWDGFPAEAWQQCIEAARRGCRESQAALFGALRQELVVWANRGLARRFQAKFDGSDVVQQTLLDAAAGMGAFRGHSRAELVVWLKGILQHRLADARRHYEGFEKRRVSREVPLEDAPAIGADDTSPSMRAARHESEERVERALGRLPESLEHVIRLRNQLNFTLAEVAAALGCSQEAASKRWGRAIRRLRYELKRDDLA